MHAPTADRIASLLEDPHWFADGFDPVSGTIGLVRATRDDIAAQPFLDWRWKRGNAERSRVAVSTAAALLASESMPPAPRFIWHTGFCCSTLLAQALNAPGCNLSLCEPQLLVEVADAKRAGAFVRVPVLGALPHIAFRLLSRRFEPGSAITLKPAPAANHLLPESLWMKDARHLFLFSGCESFVISVARLGEQGTRYVHGMLGVLIRNGARLDGIVPGQCSGLQIAALVWRMQIAEFHKSWLSLGDRARSLDCDRFLANPKDTLSKLDDFFELGLGHQHPDRITQRALFARNAKNPSEAFDSDRRRNEHAAMRIQLGEMLDNAIVWARENGPAAPPLPDSLIEKVPE